MEKIKVAVIYGGASNEHEVSQGSAKTIIENLNKEKYEILEVYINKEGKWLNKEGEPTILSPNPQEGFINFSENSIAKIIKVDVLFPVLLGKYGEDGTIQGLFEMSRIPYVGCGVLASAISMEKVYSNDILKLLGINGPKYLSYRTGDNINSDFIIKELGLPLFVKPVRSGSSVGISRVKTKEELQNALTLAFEHDSRVIIEESITGRELKCAVLGDGKNNTIASFPGETIVGEAEFNDYDTKYNNPNTKKEIPANVSKEVTEEIRKLSVKIFKALDCTGLARVDFFLNEKGEILFNEINTFPAFTGVSIYPSLMKHMDYSMEALLDELIKISLKTVR
ncbi:MAG: D-alanine--D-alanine ligase [Defluviitaleaceae bacterium]|nr:D-alanine--D-alanine ligase [Defluviitaleaceae bacterium]